MNYKYYLYHIFDMSTKKYGRLNYIIVLMYYLKLYFYDNYQLVLHFCNGVIKFIIFGYDDVFRLENIIDLNFILYGQIFDEHYKIMYWKKIR